MSRLQEHDYLSRSTIHEVASDPIVEAFALSAADGLPMPNIPEMASVWDALGTAVQEIYNQSSSVADALGAAAETVRAAVAGE